MSDKDNKTPEPTQTTTTRPPTIADRQDTFANTEPKQGTPVKVDGDITPISRQPITSVNSSQWEKLSLGQLHDQLSALEQRLLYAQQIGHIDMVTQIQRGVNEIRGVIQRKTPKEIKLI